MQMIAVDIVSGFLGAGKTTYIKKMIAEAYRGEKLVLIENEFGEVGVDGSFLSDRDLIISEINSGCICCSLAGDFADAVKNAAAQYGPSRILIEPSGVGKLSEIIASIRALSGRETGIALGSAVTLVDPTRLDTYLASFEEFYEDQIVHADMLILSRTGRIPAEQTREAAETLRRLNSRAVLLTTPWDVLSGQQILEAQRARPSLANELYAALVSDSNLPAGTQAGGDGHACRHEEGHHHADALFQSWSTETPTALTEAAVRTALQELGTGRYGAVLRAKGVLPAADGDWLHFDYVPGEMDIRRGNADLTGKLCVIGVGLKREALTTLFGL